MNRNYLADNQGKKKGKEKEIMRVVVGGFDSRKLFKKSFSRIEGNNEKWRK